MKNFLILFLLISTLFFSGCTKTEKYLEGSKKEKIIADKIEVVHFHATEQCWSCIEVGKLAFETIKERFPEEYKNEKIIFREINVDLTENKEIVFKYQARGSALYINVIDGKEEYIEEDIMVWRLISDEIRFKNYLANKLAKYLKK